MKLALTTAAAIFAATAAFAIPATDAPITETPPRSETPVTPLPGPTLPNPPEPNPPSDSEPLPLFSQPDQMPCCTRDGAILYHAPLGIDRDGTRAFCAALDVSLIPACKSWVAK